MPDPITLTIIIVTHILCFSVNTRRISTLKNHIQYLQGELDRQHHETRLSDLSLPKKKKKKNKKNKKRKSFQQFEFESDDDDNDDFDGRENQVGVPLLESNSV